MEASSPAAPSSIEIVRLLAESSRRTVVAALVLSPDGATTDQLVAATSLSVRDVMSALDRLANGGLVDHRGDDTYELVHDVFQHAARAEVPPADPSQHGDLPDDEARVLDTSFVDGKLVNLPAKRSKRLIVLDFLAQQFEIGTHYPEREVNEILAGFDPDVAMLRRWLVDERFLDRNGGFYWRCGGSV